MAEKPNRMQVPEMVDGPSHYALSQWLGPDPRGDRLQPDGSIHLYRGHDFIAAVHPGEWIERDGDRFVPAPSPAKRGEDHA